VLSNYYRDILLNRLESEITRVALVSNASVASDTLDISTLREVGRVTPTFEQIENSLQITANFNDSTANCVETYITGSITANSFVVNSASGLGTGDLIFVNDIDYTIQNVSGSTITTTQNFILTPQVNDIVRKYINQIHYVKNGTDTANSGETAFCKNYRTFKTSPQTKKITTLITLSINIKIENFVSTAYTSLDAPLNLTVTDTTIDSASFEWDLVTGASRYKLYIGLLPNQGDLLPSYNGLDVGNVDNFTTSNDLPSGQTLYVSVKAVNNYTESNFSSEQTFATDSTVESVAYISNKVTRDYNYLTDFAKSFDEKISDNSTRDERLWGTGKISPDGRYYAFDVDFYGSGNYQIFIHDFVTDTDIQITADNSNTYSSPCWNPNDPNFVYFIRNIAGTSGNDTLCKAPIDGSGTITSIRNISNGYYAYNGMFDPGGNYFIWCGLSNAAGTNFYIASLPASNLAAGSITNLETNTASSNYTYIFVSTNKVYYRKLVAGVYQIHDMTLVGGSKTQRTTGAGNKRDPVVKPDESKILYSITSGSDIYILSADTTPDMSGYYTNTATWLNNTGNLTELASDWKGVLV
jgi:hypothetical protein